MTNMTVTHLKVLFQNMAKTGDRYLQCVCNYLEKVKIFAEFAISLKSSKITTMQKISIWKQ